MAKRKLIQIRLKEKIYNDVKKYCSSRNITTTDFIRDYMMAVLYNDKFKDKNKVLKAIGILKELKLLMN